MGLVRGGVEEKVYDTPPPTLTVEEFREQYTQAHRSEMFLATQALWEKRRNAYMAQGMSKMMADAHATADGALAREGLRLLSEVHPATYQW